MAEAGVVVDLKQVDAEVRDAGVDGLLDRGSPGCGRLVREACDEVEAEVGDSGGAEAGDLVEAHLARMEAADGGGFSIDKGLDPKADAVGSFAEEGVEGLGGDLAGGGFDGDLGFGGEGEVTAEGGEEAADLCSREETGGSAAEIEGVRGDGKMGSESVCPVAGVCDLAAQGFDVHGDATRGEAV